MQFQFLINGEPERVNEYDLATALEDEIEARWPNYSRDEYQDAEALLQHEEKNTQAYGRLLDDLAREYVGQLVGSMSADFAQIFWNTMFLPEWQPIRQELIRMRFENLESEQRQNETGEEDW